MDQVLIGCGAVITICSLITNVVAVIKLARTPKNNLDTRLANIESRIARHDELLASDNKRISVIEEGNRVTQKALLALLAHGIDGNNISALEEAKNDLQKFLIER